MNDNTKSVQRLIHSFLSQAVGFVERRAVHQGDGDLVKEKTSVTSKMEFGVGSGRGPVKGGRRLGAVGQSNIRRSERRATAIGFYGRSAEGSWYRGKERMR